MTNPVDRPWVPVKKALENIGNANRGRSGLSFLILGAGMAGMAAAHELRRFGHNVRILEGSNRAGGRVFTHRFKNGTTAELGAMRIPEAHDYTFHYIEEMGLSGELREFRNNNPAAFFDIRGKISRIGKYAEEILPIYFKDLNDNEQSHAKESPAALLRYYMKPLIDELTSEDRSALVAGDFSSEKLRKLDLISWQNYLQTLVPRKYATESGLRLVGEVLSIAAVWEWSMAAILRDELHQPGSGLLAIKGGMDRLPNALAEKLPKETIRYGARVSAITLNPDGRGTVQVAGDRSPIAFDRLLCTIPFPVLRRITRSGFSDSKNRAIENIRYASAVKVFFSYPTRWWEAEPYKIHGGASFSDRPKSQVLFPRQAYYPSDTVPFVRAEKAKEDFFSIYGGETAAVESESAERLSPQRPGSLLACYTLNQGANLLCREQPRRRAELVAESLKEMHPEVATHEESIPWCWDEHIWTRGALAITPPGDLSLHLANAKKNEGRIYFAGEHVSIAHGWIQGALESSLREVARMLLQT